uniref:Uncharacterized protein n=1 Tax=Helianthus annuus TaxID=4232 RepID=A0A251SE37_HELAN
MYPCFHLFHFSRSNSCWNGVDTNPSDWCYGDRRTLEAEAVFQDMVSSAKAKSV